MWALGGTEVARRHVHYLEKSVVLMLVLFLRLEEGQDTGLTAITSSLSTLSVAMHFLS
jgi:hypothetical protein